MNKIAVDLSTMANVEQPPKLMGRAVTMTLAPLPANKRRRKFAKVDFLPEDIDQDDEDDEEEVVEESESTAKVSG
jgi:translation initiation factor IF-3